MFSLILSIIISACIASWFIWQQRRYYKENKARLEKAKDFFLENDTYSVVSVGEDKLIDSSNIEGDLKNLVNELNKYMSRNKGTTDFSIIQNKTERFAQTIFENASSNLAFPTYMGLQGTFFGIIIGLLGFVGPDICREFGISIVSTEENNVICLIAGVIVSMITSLIGLILTTLSNKTATEYKRIMDERKNIFYDFVQNELMPVLGMSVVAALTQLKETLLHFHESFDVITNKFEKTFDRCTDKFGKEFEKNIMAVGNAADKLGKSIDIVNVNVANQQALLKELRSDGMMKALDRFIDAGRQFKKSSDTVKELDNVRSELTSAIATLLDTQRDYNASLVVPKLIAERLNVILERITTFEDSINALGVNISRTHMLGNSEISLIQEHLDNIKRKDDIVVEYQETANEELKALFDAETKIIKDLHRQYTSAIEQHGNEFNALMDEVAKAIIDKKKEFMHILQDAFDVAELNTEFAHLKKLPEIHDKIGSLNTSVDDFKMSVKKQSESEIGKLDAIGNRLDSIPDSIKKLSEENQKHIAETRQEIKTDISSLSASTRNIDEKTVAIASNVDAVKAIAASIDSSNTETKSLFENQINSIAEKLSIMDSSLDLLKENARMTVKIGKEELLDVAKAIKQQQNELSILDNMLYNTKIDISDNFAKIFETKIHDLSSKIDGIESHIDSINMKAKDIAEE